MENLVVTINLPNLRLNIPEKEINFHYLERIIFALSRKKLFPPLYLSTR